MMLIGKSRDMVVPVGSFYFIYLAALETFDEFENSYFHDCVIM